MTWHLNKHNYKVLKKGISELWIEYDPIGVMDDEEWPRDEYDTYVMGSMSLLIKRAPWQELYVYVCQAHENMGVEFDKIEVEHFAKKLRAYWFNKLDGKNIEHKF